MKVEPAIEYRPLTLGEAEVPDRPFRAPRRHRLRISIRSLIILVLAAGGWLGWLIRSARIQRESVDAKENQQIGEWIAARATTSQPGPLNMIGNLATTPYWSNVLLLTEEQKVVITRLDKLVRKSHYHSLMADAEPFDGPPAVRRQRLAHNDEEAT